jgi:hypothetical protein
MLWGNPSNEARPSRWGWSGRRLGCAVGDDTQTAPAANSGFRSLRPPVAGHSNRSAAPQDSTILENVVWPTTWTVHFAP